jgi:hypothetical protein
MRENNPLDFSEILVITGCNVQFGERDISDGQGCGQLPVINKNDISFDMQAFDR